MTLRKVLVTVVGHVDHGKTSLLDKIRHTAVTKGEAGAITQAIGVSIIPIETIIKICGPLLKSTKNTLTLPGLLCIDTPGHAAFTSLRKRGGSLADIAILVVDINEGFKPQTIESIEILKANKVPFIVAANKVDLLAGWQYDKTKTILQNLAALSHQYQGEFEKKMYELVGQFHEHSITSERFDRVQDYTKEIAIVPISALTGQGLPELFMVLTGLAQKYLEQNLHVDHDGPAKGTILEVTEVQGLGTTIDTIIYNGTLKTGDQIVVGSLDQPIVTKVRALLEPGDHQEMREKKSKFKNVKQVVAATGVKIVAPNLDGAIAGMPVQVVQLNQLEQIKEQIMQEIGQVIVGDNQEMGVMIKADTLGGLEALRNLLEQKEIPISSASLGDISKKDLASLESLKDKDEFIGVLLGFNIKVPSELQAQIKSKNLSIFTNNVIYQTIDDYLKYIQQKKQAIEKQEFASLTRPCKFAILKGHTFRQSNPAIVGVEIEVGTIKSGDPIMNLQGKHLSTVKSMKDGKESVSTAPQGKQIAMAIDHVTVGRQIEEGDFLYTDIPEGDFKKLKVLKAHLSKMELDVLKEIAQIKRNHDPVWGIGQSN